MRKLKTKRQKKYRYIALGLIIGAGGMYAFQAIEKGKEAMVFEQPAPITLPAQEEYTAPDPCGLEVVVCEGEYGKQAFATTYNAEEGQTDASPEIMATGKKVHERAVASNCYEFGTEITIEGMGTFVVEDRMNSRYTKECGQPVVLDEEGRYVSGERIDIFKWRSSDNFAKQISYK